MIKEKHIELQNGFDSIGSTFEFTSMAVKVDNKNKNKTKQRK